jgi:hypothetical protein
MTGMLYLEAIASDKAGSSTISPDEAYAETKPTTRLAMIQAWQPTTKYEQLQKRVLLAESTFDYKTACQINEELIGLDGIPNTLMAMTHFALQRCYEKIGDEEHERKELLWIKENVLPVKSKYHYAYEQITSSNKDHIADRMIWILNKVNVQNSFAIVLRDEDVKKTEKGDKP